MTDFLGASDVQNSIRQSINPSRSAIDGQNLAEDFQQFLTLLTTQLQNQDPTDPLDTNQFTSQLVEFASVEQQIASNQNLEQLVALAGKTGVNASVGYIGRFIETPGNTGILENGQAAFIYDLDRSASDVDVTIRDSVGRVVFSGDGSTQAGKNVVVWDGINSTNGQEMPNGEYTISVRAKDRSGVDVESSTLTTGRVSAVELGADGNVILQVGNLSINADNVLAIRESAIVN